MMKKVLIRQTSGNLSAYLIDENLKPMEAEIIKRYGILLATRFREGWQVRGTRWLKPESEKENATPTPEWRPATEKEASELNGLPVFFAPEHELDPKQVDKLEEITAFLDSLEPKNKKEKE